MSDVGFADVDGDLVFSYNLLIDGRPVDDFTVAISDYIYTGGSTLIAGAEDPVSLGNGDYTVTIPGGVAAAGEAARFFLRVTNGMTRAVVSGDFPAPALPDIASDASCGDCHGPKGLTVHTSFGYPGMESSECAVCHKNEGGLPFLVFEDSYVGTIHGIHNAGNFPEGFYAWGDKEYNTTYPTYMTNCSVCHREEPQLAAANTMPVTGEGCFTCHGGMDGFDFTDLAFHLNIPNPETADCGECHNGSLARATVADYHNGLTTERGGIIFAGVDTSVVEGAKIDWQITGVVDDGETLEISWTATYDGTGVNPCNATAGSGAPVFFADGNGNLSILRNYAQGGDYILGTNPNTAGQPGSAPGVNADNTTCSGNVATTVVAVEDVDAKYGRVAIQGKPRVPSVLGGGELMAVRAFTPTFDWVIGDGAVAPERRAVVDSGDCLKCHVGSMYQHGGNRVDNVDMCYLCHNTAANEQYVRVNSYGVDASEAYDGKVGQNFGMKEMVHAVHSAGETGAPIVIYRGRGIFAWAGDESLLSNWPGSGRFPVFGSDDGAGNPVEQNHSFHSPTYPRALNDCAACHVDGFAILPSALEAMASTVGTGDAPFGDQVNDVLEGAQTSSCMTCHRSDDPSVEALLKAHAYQNSWVPQAFPEGRQTIIDAVK
ncbi:MAG: multiheme c-type cytochrome [Gammaproteobacteria bacterium]